MGAVILKAEREEMSEQRSFSETEDEIILRCYPVKGAKPLADLLGRTEKSIYHRAHALGASTPRAWSAEDDAIVVALYCLEGAIAVQGRLSAVRTAKAIGLRAKRLGVSLISAPRPATEHPNVRQGWSLEEDSVLRRFAQTIPLKELHLLYFEGDPFDRSYAAVAQRCSAMGLTAPRTRIARPGSSNPITQGHPWTAPMLDELMRLVRNGCSPREAARHFEAVPEAEVHAQHAVFVESMSRPRAPRAHEGIERSS